MAINEREINLKINLEIKKYETLKKSFLKIFESEQKASKSRRENFEKIRKVQESDNASLRDIYNLFISEMKALEDKRDIHLNKIMDLILPVTDYYPQKLKITKKNLDDLSKVRKNKAKLEKSRNEIKNDNVAEVQRLNADIAKSKNEEIKKGQSLESEMVKFESERVDDNKFLFLHYIHSELKYHAAALEKMSELFFKINSMDPRIHLREFANNFGQNDYDFKGKLGIDMDKIEEEDERRRNEEDEKINDVYGSRIKQSKKASVRNSNLQNSQLSESNNNNIDTHMMGSKAIEDELEEV